MRKKEKKKYIPKRRDLTRKPKTDFKIEYSSLNNHAIVRSSPHRMLPFVVVQINLISVVFMWRWVNHILNISILN